LTPASIAFILAPVTQIPLFTPEPASNWSVSDLNKYIRELLESDHNLGDVWVSGEVSNFSQPRSGHLYFTLKDADAAVKCVMWKGQALKLRFLPRDGDAVEVHGKISVYEVGGQYQLYVDQLQPAGEGLLYQEFQRLKSKLEAEGLFEMERKQPIPKWPRSIGIVTSPTGAALQDMLNTLQRRYPLVEVIVAPTAVQGIDAPGGIVQAIQALHNLPEPPDTILVARGGGSIEDLWAFNDETVVREIAGSAIPLVTGVGHDTDFTLSDFASDLRAPTPTAAAELATPDKLELQQTIDEFTYSLDRGVQLQVEGQRWKLLEFQNLLRQHSPDLQIQLDGARLKSLQERLHTTMAYRMQIFSAKLMAASAQLNTLNPLAILGRGYSMVTNKDGEVIQSIEQVRSGDRLTIQVRDGAVDVSVNQKRKNA
jgi:exodeoxyribonuclease VII large subunit